MEMSLPRSAVAKLFWTDSHWKSLCRAGKLGHIHGAGQCLLSGARAAVRAKTKEVKRVALFIQGKGYTDLSKTNKILELTEAKQRSVLRETWQ